MAFSNEPVSNAAATEDTYPLGARYFHWVMAALIIAVWIIGFASAHLQGLLPRAPTLALHKSIASAVLFIALMRIVYRYRARKRYPSHPMILIARCVHVLLYVIAMVAVPLSGWYWSSIVGKPPVMFGLVPLPSIARPDPTLYQTAAMIHRIAAWTAGSLVMLHMLAVLKHILIDRKNILRPMLGQVVRPGP